MMSRLSTKQKVFAGLGLYILVAIVITLLTGWSRSDNTEFQPQNEFKLDTWFSLGPIDFNKAVMYLLIAATLTVLTMTYIARRMQAKPNRVQTAVEVVYALMRDNITRGSMNEQMAARWFPFIATLFLFILFSNLIGYIPLPTNTEHKFDLFGLHIPSFALYAATANISIPLALTLMVWFAYHFEGVRVQGVKGYLNSWIPAGTPGGLKPVLFFIEVISHFVRIVSLSVRLFANILAGHLLILFMAGGLAVILGLSALGVVTLPVAIVFFLFEVGLVATLQAFIFATLTAIYLGGATSEHH
jgi:F-type H+-transporting ATPase subunit a